MLSLMDGAMIHSRAYSTCSARQLVSGKGSQGPALSSEKLIHEFRNHAKKASQTPTALVSCSDRIVDTVKRAFDICHQNLGSPEEIWIALIRVEATAKVQVHHAQQLAKECNLPEPGRFCHEFIFEWVVPKDYVYHQVSLRTLMDRGLGKKQLQCLYSQMTTEELRHCIAEELGPLGPYNGGWEIGIYVGSFAQTFGARAPLNWIARQLFDDCVRTKLIDENSARLKFAHGYCETVDGDFFSDLDHGIETALCDWWLADTDFFRDYKAFEEWRDMLKQSIDWGYGDHFEIWHDETIQDRLLGKHAEIYDVIEARAIELGL